MMIFEKLFEQLCFNSSFCIGEPLPLVTAATLLENMPPKAKLVNAYGPAECTLASTNHVVTEEDISDGRIPIGRPDPGHECIVCDDRLTPVPNGEIGELLVGGSYYVDHTNDLASKNL